jgi:hypothetical protein
MRQRLRKLLGSFYWETIPDQEY